MIIMIIYLYMIFIIEMLFYRDINFILPHLLCLKLTSVHNFWC